MTMNQPQSVLKPSAVEFTMHRSAKKGHSQHYFVSSNILRKTQAWL